MEIGCCQFRVITTTIIARTSSRNLIASVLIERSLEEISGSSKGRGQAKFRPGCMVYASVGDSLPFAVAAQSLKQACAVLRISYAPGVCHPEVPVEAPAPIETCIHTTPVVNQPLVGNVTYIAGLVLSYPDHPSFHIHLLKSDFRPLSNVVLYAKQPTVKASTCTLRVTAQSNHLSCHLLKANSAA